MAKSVEDRYTSMQEFADALDGYPKGAEGQSSDQTGVGELDEAVRRNHDDVSAYHARGETLVQ